MMVGTILMIFCSVASNALRVTYFYTIQIIVFLPNSIRQIRDGRVVFLFEVLSFIACYIVFEQFMQGFLVQNMEYIPFWK